MTNKPTFEESDLRQRAEGVVASRSDSARNATTELDDKRLLHEQQVNQVELEMQNDELQRTIVEKSKLAESLQGHYSAIIESSSDTIIGKNLDGLITSWNPAAERMFGYTVSEMLGQPMTPLIPPERENEEQLILEKICRGEYIDHFETVRRRKNGELFPVSVTISPIKDRSGAIIGAAKIARDVTERRLAEQTLEDSQTRLRTVLDGVQSAVITITEHGTIESFNHSAEIIFGYTADVIAHHGVLDEGMHFIHKPFALPDLAIKVRKVLDGK